jgi:hypothetical protein
MSGGPSWLIKGKEQIREKTEPIIQLNVHGC